MSKLGNIESSYGQQFNIGIANTYSYNILSGTNIPKNIIIISSPIDDENNDIGTYSLMCTDSLGNPIRLTYCIKEGNGLSLKNDTLYLNIDNESIKDSNGLYIDLSTIYSDIVLKDKNKLYIDNSKISISSETNRGVSKVDNSTIKSNEGLIYIDTDNLQYSNNSTSTYGIITSSDENIVINNGILSLNEENLIKASNEEYGVCHGDESVVLIKDGIITINTQQLEKCNETSFGIVIVDNNKILSNNGILSINTDKLNKSDNNNIGIINIDNNTIKLNSNDQITIPEYNTFINDLDNLNFNLDSDINELTEIKNDILSKLKQ